MDRGLQSASASLDKFAKQAGSALVGAFAMDKIIGGFSTAIEKGDQLQDLANRFGVSAVSIQEIGNAASLSGAGVEDVASAMNKLAKNAGEAIGGNETMAESFAKIGLKVEDLKGMSPEDLFFALSKSVASASDPLVAFAVAQEVAGKSVASLMETLRMGPDAIAANGQAMGVWSEETIASLSEASDAIKTFQNEMTIGFGYVAQATMPLITAFKAIAEELTVLAMASIEFLKGNIAGAKELVKVAGQSSYAGEVTNNKKQAEKKKAAAAGAGGAGNVSKADAKTVAAAEKDAIKDRTDEAMRILANEESEKKLANDSYERDRARATERMLEAANIEVQAAMEKQKMNQKQANEMAGPGGTSRQYEQTKAGAATEVLGFAGALGDKGISDTVTKERAKAAKEQQKINKEEFDAKVRESTSATAGGGPRTMASRRQEFIKSEAGKEAKGQKTLSDVYTVLDEALRKLTSAPLVGAGV
jgi:hypothetical protein